MQQQQQQQNSFIENYKRNFNITYSLFLMHQRALTVPMRNRYGVQALGTPCALALVLMFLWAIATRDPFMWLWMGVWLLCHIQRRIESLRLARKGARIHSLFDGVPYDAMRYVKNERIARLVVEPILIGILGCIVLWIYTENGWRPTGLPYFLLSGVVTLPFVQLVQQMIWDKRLQAMNDGQIEQQALVKDFRDRYGDS